MFLDIVDVNVVVTVGDGVVVLDVVDVGDVIVDDDDVVIVDAVEDRQYITCQLSKEATTYIKQHNIRGLLCVTSFLGL